MHRPQTIEFTSLLLREQPKTPPERPYDGAIGGPKRAIEYFLHNAGELLCTYTSNVRASPRDPRNGRYLKEAYDWMEAANLLGAQINIKDTLDDVLELN